MKPITTQKRKLAPSGAPRLALLVVALVIVVAAIIVTKRRGAAPHEATPPENARQDAALPEAAPQLATNTSSVAAAPSTTTPPSALVVQGAASSLLTPATVAEPSLRKYTDATLPSNDADLPPSAQIVPVASTGYFETPLENNLVALSRGRFDSLAGIRYDLSQEEALAILRTPIEIDGDDDEDEADAKRHLASMKAAAIDYIEAGGTLNQFLRDCQAEAYEAAETVRDVRDEMLRILHDEGEDSARAYLVEANAALREAGLKEVKLGNGTIRMMERRKAREEATAAGQ